MCALCSRLNRENLCGAARQECRSYALLGHHRDDILETFIMTTFHGSRLETMSPN